MIMFSFLSNALAFTILCLPNHWPVTINIANAESNLEKAVRDGSCSETRTVKDLQCLEDAGYKVTKVRAPRNVDHGVFTEQPTEEDRTELMEWSQSHDPSVDVQILQKPQELTEMVKEVLVPIDTNGTVGTAEMNSTDGNCRQSFAFSNEKSTCFHNLNRRGNLRVNAHYFDQWGWRLGTIEPNDGLTHTYPMYASNDGCDSTDQQMVGYATVHYDGENANTTITFNDGFSTIESYVYVGFRKLPRDPDDNFSVSPEYYTVGGPTTPNTTEVKYVVSDLKEKKVYVIIYALICEEEKLENFEGTTPITLEVIDHPDALVKIQDVKVEDDNEVGIVGYDYRKDYEYDSSISTSKMRSSHHLSHKDRQFQENTGPGQCNDGIEEAPCTSWSSFLTEANIDPKEIMVEIPCGKCVSMDVENGTTIELPNGLNVIGMIHFPNTAHVVVRTTSVIVQGVFKVDPAEIGTVIPHERQIKFLFHGRNSTAFYPHGNNSMACGIMPNTTDQGMPCNVGFKAFTVAGGKVDIKAIDPECPSWGKLVSAEMIGHLSPSKIPDFSPPPTPDGCSRSIVEDYSSSKANPTLQLEPEDWGCLIPNEAYIVHGKIRIATMDPTISSNCSENGEMCPRFELEYKSDGNGEISRLLGRISQGYGRTMIDGEAFDFTFVTSFEADELADVTAMAINVTGVEENVDVFVDEFTLKMHSEESHPGNMNQCDNLVPADGSAENLGNGINPYPFSLGDGDFGGVLHIESDVYHQSNRIFALRGRRGNFIGLEFRISSTKCLVEGSKYKFSMKYRMRNQTLEDEMLKSIMLGNETLGIEKRENIPEGQVEVSVIYPRPSDGGLVMAEIGKCPEPQWNSDVWTSCNIFFVANRPMTNAQWLTVKTNFFGDADSDIEYDDFQMKVVPKPNAVVVSEPNAAKCWGPGAEILFTSDTIQADHYQTAKIAGSDAETGVIYLERGLDRAPTSLADDPLYAVEVALLNRNFIFEAEEDKNDPLLGGHMLVLHTPYIVQTIEGVEIINFGQQGNMGRYPIHFHMSENCEGSLISRNVIRQSNQRCVVIHGTHNVTIQHNVAFDTFAHCFITEDGGEYGNVFQYNLGAGTKSIPQEKLLRPFETDHVASTFWITNPMNDMIGNCAAGASGSGIWLEFPWAVRPPSLMLGINQGIVPRSLPLGIFKDNIAHSNGQNGMTNYQTGHEPFEQPIYENPVAYKNNWSGLFLHNSNLAKVAGGHMADNWECVRTLNANNVEIEDLECVGFSDNFKGVLNSGGLRHPWSHCCPACGKDLHGISYTPNQGLGKGLTLTNISFSNFVNSGLCEGYALVSERELLMLELQDCQVTYRNISFDSDTNRISVCHAVESQFLPFRTKNMAIEDFDGTISGRNEPGFYVQDDPGITSLVPGSCEVGEEGSCMQYCPGLCLRLVVVEVTSSIASAHMQMVVTNVNGTSSVTKRGYAFGDSDPLGLSEINKGYFAIWLPDEHFDISFIDANGKQAWPDFVHLHLEEPPKCKDYINSTSINLVKPPYSNQRCEELVKNGDLESGTLDGWKSLFVTLNVVQPGSSMSPEHALNTTNRTKWWSAVVQNLDVSCLSESKAQYYSVSGNFRLKDAQGFHITCDPALALQEPFACPQLSLFFHFWDKDERREVFRPKITIDRLLTSDGGNFTSFHHVVFIPKHYREATNVKMVVVGSKFDYEMDDFSIKPRYVEDQKQWIQINGKGELEPQSDGTTVENRKRFYELLNASPNKIIMRYCTSCQKEYRYLFIKRLTNFTDVPLLHYLEDNWVEYQNILNQDVAVFSTYENALEKTNHWNYLTFKEGVGCCFDNRNPFAWASFNGINGTFPYGEGQPDVAYFIEGTEMEEEEEGAYVQRQGRRLTNTL